VGVNGQHAQPQKKKKKNPPKEEALVRGELGGGETASCRPTRYTGQSTLGSGGRLSKKAGLLCRRWEKATIKLNNSLRPHCLDSLVMVCAPLARLGGIIRCARRGGQIIFQSKKKTQTFEAKGRRSGVYLSPPLRGGDKWTFGRAKLKEDPGLQQQTKRAKSRRTRDRA